VRDPFHPTFGASPPLFVGREDLIEDVVEAVENGPGSMGRASLFTGARGTGKTALLNEIQDRVRALGWLVISETAHPGLIERLRDDHLPAILRDLDPKAVTSRMTGLSVPKYGGGVTRSVTEKYPWKASLRNQTELVCDLLAQQGTGLLITVDELQANAIEEMRELFTVVQHAFRDERELAFVGAGLPAAVSDILNDDVLTFLRRANRHALGPVSQHDAKRALRLPFEEAGRTVADRAINEMVKASRGYPYLIQLIGSSVFQALPREQLVTYEVSLRGIDKARRRLGEQLYEPALHDVSEADRKFLKAMAKCGSPASVGEIQKRLDVSKQYVNRYRNRLVAADLIEVVERGRVDFVIPYMRDYLLGSA
jgi:hypothetical protein